ncbi:MAG: hypothetical protein H7A25_19135 [Leptospiraceae bacterium]|nr:hypothetical protein [Leptospiraceae bacterium]
MLFDSGDKSFKILFGENINHDLLPIEIEGKKYYIPGSVCLLRGFHYIALTTEEFEISLKKHCWNGSCENCKCVFDDEQMGITEGLSCLMNVDRNLKLLNLPFTMKRKKNK